VSAWRAAAIDLGAESGRVVVGELADGVFTVDEVHRFPNAGVSVRGRVHWDVLGLFQEILFGLASARGGGGTVSWPASGARHLGSGLGSRCFDRAAPSLGNPAPLPAIPRTRGRGRARRRAVPLREPSRARGCSRSLINTLFTVVANGAQQPRAAVGSPTGCCLMPDLFPLRLGGEAGQRADHRDHLADVRPAERWLGDGPARASSSCRHRCSGHRPRPRPPRPAAAGGSARPRGLNADAGGGPRQPRQRRRRWRRSPSPPAGPRTSALAPGR
jgi:rhamnulokinase